MAGSIFKKLRGLLAKFWAKLQLFLKRDGLRVIFGKTQGLLYKFANADRFLSRLTSAWFVSGRPMEIVRLRARGRAGGGAGSRRRAPTAAGGGASAGLHLVRCSGPRFEL